MTLRRRLLSPVLGQPRLQPLFETLQKVALAGMGYGEGNDPASSGEERALGFVQARLGAAEDITVFDVGANVGEYAEQVLERWGTRAHLWCFEPSRETFGMLGARLGERPGVTLQNLGLSDTEGTLTLHSRGAGSKVASVYEGRATTWAVHELEEVKVRTLDAYCREQGIDHIDLLKLDVEGHELSVLRGAKTMFEDGSIRFVQFEMSAACIDARVFFRDYWETLSQGYSLYRIAAHGLIPIPAYQETQEVFRRATNYLAERRSVR